NTPVIKELQDDIQRNATAIELIQNEMQVQFCRAEIANAERFGLMHEALKALLKKDKGESSPGAMNSFKPPFQVRSVKLDFLRFD
ncbi:hypothetical protein A2U01_0062106, partial [Trifolium medium]|nr:hypothetical protein [Trifolium medium]